MSVFEYLRAGISGPIIVSEPNKFHVYLVNVSALPPSDRELFFQNLQTLGPEANKAALLIPGVWQIPTGFREVGRGNAVTCAAGGSAFPADAYVVVADKAKLPHILEGKKGAAHITITVTVDLPKSVAIAFLNNKGKPLTPTQFLQATGLVSKEKETQTLSFMVCAQTGAVATFDAYSRTFTEFGGSADVVADMQLETTRLETSPEILLRETFEEGGAVVKLIGLVREKAKIKQTLVEIGGPYGITVEDSYSKAVSHTVVDLATLRNVISRAKADGKEVIDLGIVLLPDVLSDEKRRSNDEQLNEWFIQGSEKQREGMVRMGRNIVESRDWDILEMKTDV